MFSFEVRLLIIVQIEACLPGGSCHVIGESSRLSIVLTIRQAELARADAGWQGKGRSENLVPYRTRDEK